MITTIDNAILLDIPKIQNNLGNLSVIEGNTIPFEIGHVYYLNAASKAAEKYGSAQMKQQKVLVALNGSLEVFLYDGQNEKKVVLNKPNQALYVPAGMWCEMRDFPSGTVCLIVASAVFDESDYITDKDDFKLFKHSISQSNIG